MVVIGPAGPPRVTLLSCRLESGPPSGAGTGHHDSPRKGQGAGWRRSRRQDGQRVRKLGIAAEKRHKTEGGSQRRPRSKNPFAYAARQRCRRHCHRLRRAAAGWRLPKITTIHGHDPKAGHRAHHSPVEPSRPVTILPGAFRKRPKKHPFPFAPSHRDPNLRSLQTLADIWSGSGPQWQCSATFWQSVDMKSRTPLTVTQMKSSCCTRTVFDGGRTVRRALSDECSTTA